MNEEKRIAGAILDAQKMREASYDTTGSATDPGFYKLDMEECLIATCKQRGLSPNLWALLNLAMHWWNDIQLWAEDILAGKNILEECQKENVKMKDGIKRVGKVGGVDCPCDSASKEACDQCQEIGLADDDSAGKANPQNYS